MFSNFIYFLVLLRVTVEKKFSKFQKANKTLHNFSDQFTTIKIIQTQLLANTICIYKRYYKYLDVIVSKDADKAFCSIKYGFLSVVPFNSQT